MHPRVAYVTPEAATEPDTAAALSAIEAAGMDAQSRSWDSDTAWDEYDLVLVRSAWGHEQRRQDFLRWARWVEDHTRLANPAVTLARNTDRTYLRDLRQRGLAIVDTLWFEPGDDPAAFDAEISARGWEICAVRPHIGGTAAHVLEGGREVTAAAQSWASQGAVAMVQPADWVSRPGAQVSVVFVGGRVCMAVTSHTGDAPVAMGATRVSIVELDQAVTDLAVEVHATASAGERLLYARVDLVQDAGDWSVWGFEATDPSLFLDTDPRSAAAMGHAVRTWIIPEAQAADFLVGSG